MGDRPRAAPSPRTLATDDTEPEKLDLLAKEGQFEPIASLYPFLTFRYCDSCSAYQAFVLNTSKGNTLDYVSYQCTHHYTRAEFLDLQELLHSIGADNVNEVVSGAPPLLPPPPLPPPPKPYTAKLAETNRPEQSTQQALEESERQAREAAERDAKEEAARREEAQRQAQAAEKRSGNEQEPHRASSFEGEAGQWWAQRQKEDQERRTREQEQSRLREEQIARMNGERQTAQVAQHAPPMPYYVAPPLPRRGRSIVLWVSVAALLLLIGISAIVLSIKPDDHDGVQATATARAFAGPTETAIAIGSATAAAQPHLLDTLAGHTGGVWSMAFSPDGTLLASGSQDDSIKLWRVADGRVIRTLTGHTAAVHSVAFSLGGKMIASASFDGTIKLWGVADGTLVRTLTPGSVAIGRASQPFPRSKPSRRLSPHSAFQQGGFLS